MGPTGVDWTWGATVLAAGLLLGMAFVWRFLRADRGATRPAAAPIELRDLVGKREVLLAQLRELEDTAAKRTTDQLAHERYALEIEAARVLQAIDEAEHRAAPAKPRKEAKAAARKQPAPEAAAGFLADRPGLRGFVWGTGSTGAIGLLVFLVFQAVKPRSTGGSLTGNIPMEERRPAEGEASAEEGELRAAVSRNPEDLDSRLGLARLYLARQDMMAAWNETQYVLKRSPGNPRALAYQSLVRLAMGQADAALKMVKQALATDPDLFEGYLHEAVIYARMGRLEDVDTVLGQASRRFPERAAMLQQVKTELRRAVAEGPAAPEGDPHSGISDPEEVGAPVAGADDAEEKAGRTLRGVVDIDAGLKGTVPRAATLFVTVRPAGLDSGPPVAVKRIFVDAFPATFAIGPGDSMMGQTIPNRVRVEARLDSDGDPLTRSPQDPSARQDNVSADAKDLRLLLRR